MCDQDLIILKKGDFSISLPLICGVCRGNVKSLTLVAPGEYDSVEFRICMLDEVLELNEYFFICDNCFSFVLRCTTTLGSVKYSRSLSEFKLIRGCFICGTNKLTNNFTVEHDFVSLMVLQRIQHEYTFRTELVEKICSSCENLYIDLKKLYNIIRTNPKYRGDTVAAEGKESPINDRKYEDTTKKMLAKLHFSPIDKPRSKFFSFKKKRQVIKGLSSTISKAEQRPKKQQNRFVPSAYSNKLTINEKQSYSDKVQDSLENINNKNKTDKHKLPLKNIVFESKDNLDNCSKPISSYSLNDKNWDGYESEEETIPEELKSDLDYTVETNSTEIFPKSTLDEPESNSSIASEPSVASSKVINKEDVELQPHIIPAINQHTEKQLSYTDESLSVSLKSKSSSVIEISGKLKTQGEISNNNTSPYMLKPNTPVLLMDIPDNPKKKMPKNKTPKFTKNKSCENMLFDTASSLLPFDTAEDKEHSAQDVAEKLRPRVKYITKLFMEKILTCDTVDDKLNMTKELLENYIQQLNPDVCLQQINPSPSSNESSKVKNLIAELRPHFKTIVTAVSQHNLRCTNVELDTQSQVPLSHLSPENDTNEAKNNENLSLETDKNKYISKKLKPKSRTIENTKLQNPIVAESSSISQLDGEEESRNNIIELLKKFQSKSATRMCSENSSFEIQTSEKSNPSCSALLSQSTDQNDDDNSLLKLQPHFRYASSEIQATSEQSKNNELKNEVSIDSTQKSDKLDDVLKKTQRLYNIDGQSKTLREVLELHRKTKLALSSSQVEHNTAPIHHKNQNNGKKNAQYQYVFNNAHEEEEAEEEELYSDTSCNETYYASNEASRSNINTKNYTVPSTSTTTHSQASLQAKQTQANAVRKSLTALTSTKEHAKQQKYLNVDENKYDLNPNKGRPYSVKKNRNSQHHSSTCYDENDEFLNVSKSLMSKGDEVMEELEEESDSIMRNLPLNFNNKKNANEIGNVSITYGVDGYPQNPKIIGNNKSNFKKVGQNAVQNKQDTNTCMYFPTKAKTLNEIYGTGNTISKGQKKTPCLPKNPWITPTKEKSLNFTSKHNLIKDVKVSSYMNNIVPHTSNNTSININQSKGRNSRQQTRSNQELMPRRNIIAKTKDSDSDITSYPNKSCTSSEKCNTTKTSTTSSSKRTSTSNQSCSSKMKDLAKIYNVDLNKLRPRTAVPYGMKPKNQKNAQL